MRAVQRIAVASVIATAISTLALPGLAQTAPNFPSKPMRLVVPGAGQLDTLARMLGSKMSESFGQPVVVENVAGAGGILGANRVAKATPDGHSVLLAASGFAISAALHSSLPYDPRKDFAGVSQIVIPTAVLVVSPTLGVKSVKELIAVARAKPGKIIFGSSGPGTGPHLLGERFRLGSGINVVSVGLKSGQPLVETMTGRIDYSFLPLASVLPFLGDGKVVALAVATLQRSPQLPDVPTMAETFPEFAKVIGSFGLLVPAGTPRHVIDQIGKEVARILSLRDVYEWMLKGGLVPAPTSPEEYDRILHAQIEGFAELIRVAGIPKR